MVRKLSKSYTVFLIIELIDKQLRLNTKWKHDYRTLYGRHGDVLPWFGSVVKTNASCQSSQFCLHNMYLVTELDRGINTGPFQLHMELLWQPIFTPEVWAMLAKTSSGLFWSWASLSALPCFTHFHCCWFFINVFQPKLYFRVRFWRNKSMTINSNFYYFECS